MPIIAKIEADENVDAMRVNQLKLSNAKLGHGMSSYEPSDHVKEEKISDHVRLRHHYGSHLRDFNDNGDGEFEYERVYGHKAGDYPTNFSQRKMHNISHKKGLKSLKQHKAAKEKSHRMKTHLKKHKHGK